MDNKATTKRMIGAVVLVLVAALLLAWLLKGKNRDGQQDMANQTSETKPILGFQDVGGGLDQKPSVVGEDPNAAGQAQQQGIGMDGAQQAGATGQTAAQDGSLIPGVDVKMPETVANTTGLTVRPGGEVRDLVDTDGQVKKGTGSMGTGDSKPVDMGAGQDAAGGAGQGQQQAAVEKPAAGSSSSASQQDKPAASAPAPEKKSSSGSSASSKVVLVNEKPVPKAQSDESAKAAAAKAAAAKAAADKAAAEKAAAEKSKALAGKAASGTAPAAAASSGFVIQVVASSDKAKADSIAAPLKADGYNVSVATAKVSGKTVYRVSVGGYADRAAADAAQAKMKSRYSQNQYVQSSFVTSK